jgi:hypothetical protein
MPYTTVFIDLQKKCFVCQFLISINSSNDEAVKFVGNDGTVDGLPCHHRVQTSCGAIQQPTKLVPGAQTHG